MLGSRIKYVSILFCLIAAMMYLINIWTPIIKDLDDKLFKNRLENFYGILVSENWSQLSSVNNYSEVFKSGQLVGHATGFRTTKTENSVDGLIAAQALGLSHFEIDLTYDGEIIYCAHEIALIKDCKFSDILGFLKPSDLLLLDLKSDFENTVKKIRNTQGLYQHKDQMIFQLYRPNDLNILTDIFDDDQKYIFTLYRSHRSLEHICKNISGRISEIVVHRRLVEKMNQHCPDVKLILHPISDCQTLDVVLSKPNVVSALISGEALHCKI